MADDNGDDRRQHGCGSGRREARRPRTVAGTAVVATDAVAEPRVPAAPPARHRPRPARATSSTSVASRRCSCCRSSAACSRSSPTSSSRSSRATSQSVRINNLLPRLGIALGLLGIGIGAVHWSKALMHDHELVEQRHRTRGSDETRAKRGRDLHARQQGVRLRSSHADPQHAHRCSRRHPASRHRAVPRPGSRRQTPWRCSSTPCGRRACASTRDPSGTPIKASDVTIGSAFHVIPEGPQRAPSTALEEKAKAVVLLMRLNPDDLQRFRGPRRLVLRRHRRVLQDLHPRRLPGRTVRAADAPPAVPVPPVAVRRDARSCKVIFGPAKRPLPQLPITVDDEGYLVAQSDFTEPVGPSFWERQL